MHFWQGKPHHQEAPRNVDTTRTRDKAVSTLLGTRMGAFGPTINLIPLDVAEKGVDVAPRMRPIVHVVGVLMHVHISSSTSRAKLCVVKPRPIDLERTLPARLEATIGDSVAHRKPNRQASF